MVLSRRLTQVRHLEEALEAAGLRFAVEGGKSFFDRQEVHETLAVLRAIEDPTDRVSLVAALRSSFFGVSDRDIVTYALAGGRSGSGAVDETKPGGARWRPPWRCSTTCTGAARATPCPPCWTCSTTRPGSWPRSRARGAARPRSRTWRRWSRWRARPASWASSPCAASPPAPGADPSRTEEPDLPVHASGRSRHRAHPVHPQGQGPGGAGRRPLRLRGQVLQPRPTRSPCGTRARSRSASAPAASPRVGRLVTADQKRPGPRATG